MTISTPPEKRFLPVFMAVQFSHLLDYMVLMPLGGELMQRFGIDAAQFGWLIGCYALASAAGGVWGGALLDRADRKRVLLALYAGFIVATLLCASAQSYSVLLAARALAGACAGLMTATVMTLVAEWVAPERRGRAVGIVLSAFGACAVAGVPLGLWLASQWDWRAPFLFVAAFSGVVWLCVLRMLPAAPAAKGQVTRLVDLVRLRGVAWGWVLTSSIVFAGFLIVPYAGTYFTANLGVPLADLSWVYLLGGAATLVCTRWIGRATDHFGAAKTLRCLLLVSVLPHLLLTHLQPTSTLMVAAVFTLFMVINSARAVPAFPLLIGAVPPPLRGRFLGINMACAEGASGLGAWVAGFIVSAAPASPLSHFNRVGWLAVAMTGVALLVLRVVLKQRQVEP